MHAAGPKLPRHLPAACCVDKAAGVLRRPGHAPLRLPGPGERLIVARRARDRADAFTCTSEAL